jgi:two-component system OmpR family response regulator
MQQTVAIVEDDPDQSRNYADALQKHGYTVRAYATRPEALRAFDSELPDLVILDIMLGDELDGGFEVCRNLLTKKRDLPIIFLTSRTDDIDRISGLRLGAWDYQTKPVSLKYLVERVNSLFRIRRVRDDVPDRNQILNVDALEIDPQRVAAKWKGTTLALTCTEFNILLELVQSRETRGASYDDLAKATRQGIVENNTINTHIRHIRGKFRQIDRRFDCIKNLYGFGYCWSC